MSDFQHKPDSGSLFRNDNREKETQPQAKGSALIGGVEYWVSAWTNDAKDGSKYQSLKFSRKDENKAPRPTDSGSPHSRQRSDVPEDDFSDPIPF